MPSLRRTVGRAVRKSDLGWRYIYNLAPTLAYRPDRHPLSPAAQEVLEQLNEHGIGVTTAEKLLGPNSLYDELQDVVDRMETERAAELNQLRAAANDASDLGTKTFLCQLLGKMPKLATDSIWARFVLQDKILNLANAYFGMYCRLREYNVWHTFTTTVAARESQLWHRDREDLLILKVFVYLNDVDEGAGPFTYAPGTHRKGSIRATPEFHLENGVQRSVDEQMEQVVPSERWIKATGGRGTIIFADTHGYHKGGHAWRSDRLMYTSMFTSPASESRELLERSSALPAAATTQLRVALSPQRSGPWITLHN